MPGTLIHNELLTEEVQEVISYRPHWIVRRGNTVFLLIVVLLLSLTWLIQYPDMISASTRLVTLNPPKLVNAKTEGKLLKLLIANEEQVKKDQTLGYMESTANYNQVLQLQNWINETIAGLQDNNYAQIAKNPILNFQG